MFSKTALTLLALGALYVNAVTVPIARSPAPEPDFQDLMTRVDFELAKREIFDDLLSRELGDWVQISKRDPRGIPRCPAHIPKGYRGRCKKYG